MLIKNLTPALFNYIGDAPPPLPKERESGFTIFGVIMG
jgi:hypothetical protein